jgi:hypothetical protein
MRFRALLAMAVAIPVLPLSAIAQEAAPPATLIRFRVISSRITPRARSSARSSRASNFTDQRARL